MIPLLLNRVNETKIATIVPDLIPGAMEVTGSCTII
jgi:hypothetical protein